MRRHEIPTHLNVPDRFVLGLTASQTMQLMSAASLAYGLLNGAWPAFELRAALAALVVGLGLLVALVRPAGRPLEEWLLLAAYHLATPRRLVWRPCPVTPKDAAEAWTVLAPRVGWVAPVEPGEGAEHVR